LWAWKAAIVERRARLRLVIHASRAQVMPVGAGVSWLGFVVYPTHRLVKARKVRAASRRLRARLGDYHAGRISFAELDASIQGWINHVRHADSWGRRAHVLDRLPIRPAEHRRAIAARRGSDRGHSSVPAPSGQHAMNGAARRGRRLRGGLQASAIRDGGRAHHPKTDEVGPAVRVVPDAGGAPRVARSVAPGPAAQHARRAVVVRTVLDPLPNVTVHVVKAPGIGLEAPDRRGLSSIPLAAAVGEPLARFIHQRRYSAWKV
jgi:hypothetical protein